MQGGTTDAEIIEASWATPARFDEIYRRHSPAVFALLVRAVGPDDGRDLTAEVFARAFAQRARYQTSYPNSRPWLMGIAGHLIADYHRHAARERRAFSRSIGEMTTGAPDSEQDAVNRVDADSYHDMLVSAMRSLRKEERAVVGLFAVGGLSYSEIAEALGIPEGTVRSRLNRARTKLQRELSSGRHDVTP